MSRRRAVLLDRDGTLNAECHYLARPEQVDLLPGSAEGLRLMRGLGLRLVVVTNQSGLARGYFDEPTLEQVHQRLRELLQAEGADLDAIYHCPHAPTDGCACRKPEPGLVLRAAREHAFEPAEAFVVGDKPCDIDLGRRLGATTILVRTGYGANYPAGAGQPDLVAADLVAAAQLIAEHLR